MRISDAAEIRKNPVADSHRSALNQSMILADNSVPMWLMGLPWWHFVVRSLIVYAFLIVLIRITGKRQVGQLAPFDLVLLLVLSNGVQNAMNGGDNSITGGLIVATTLVAANSVISWATSRNRRVEGLIEGKPVILIHNGKLDHDHMRKAGMTIHELECALREAGCVGPEDVRLAVLENNGHVTVIPRK